MDKREVVKKVTAYKNLLQNYLSFEKLYLFGSYASGNFNEHSDIDVAIVVNRMEEDFFKINPLLWRLRREIDDRIEPVLIEKDFDDAGFLDEIQMHGIEIT